MSHQHDHHHHAIPNQLNQTFAIGISLNISFVAVEAFYGWQINSLALLADAGHNLSDVAGLLIAWLGVWATQWKANARHTYGWKRLSIMASLVNATMLLMAMCYLSWEAMHRLNTPIMMDNETIIGVATIGIMINTLTAWLFLQQGKQDLNVRAAFLHMSADALISLGVVISGALALWLQHNWFDPAISLIIAAVVGLSTWPIFKNALHLSFDGVPESLDSDAIAQTLLNIEGIISIHNLHIWALSTAENTLTAHLVYEEHYDTQALLHQIHQHLAERYHLHHVTIQLETLAYAQHCHHGQHT